MTSASEVECRIYKGLGTSTGRWALGEWTDGVAFVERALCEDGIVDWDVPRSTDAGKAAKRHILSRLAALGISSCKLDYEGEHGKSRLDHCEGKGRDAASVPVPRRA
jgi:hypothetical protein